MKTYATMALIAATTILLASCSSSAQKPAGIIHGTLSPCPDSPNCVLSENVDSAAYIQPLLFDGAPDEAWQCLQQALQSIGGNIETVEDNYLWATFRSTVFRFVDDLECRLDSERKMIHLRSASRVGYSDFGVNRKRVEKLRLEFARQLKQTSK